MSHKYSEVWLKDASNHHHLVPHILSHHNTTAIFRQGTGQDHKVECQLKVNQKIFSADQDDYRPGWLTGSYIRTH